ncbi:MAG: glycosyltransferase family 4 protein [Candidatus Thiodiazotropha sp.]
MKILFLSQIIPYPPHGGVLQRGYNIIREIGKDNDVYLLAFHHPDTIASQSLLDESMVELKKICTEVHYFKLWPKQSKIHKISAFFLGFFYPLPFSVLAHKSSGFRDKMLDIIENNNIDIVHIDTVGLSKYRELVQDIPCIVTHHNIESSLMARRSKVESNWFTRYYVAKQSEKLRKYEAQESNKYPVNIMMSNTDAKELIEMSPGAKTAIVPNGVDINYFEDRKEPEEQAIIYTGGMNMFANKDAVMYLISDIWPLVKVKIPDIKFYIIGQDPPKELTNIASDDNAIKVLGYVDDIRPFVAKSAIYVVPLRVGGGTRLKVLDALAQGKAIVSTSIGSEGIEVTDRTNIYLEDTSEGFASSIIQLINDDAKRKELGRQARKLAEEKYAWPSIAEGLIDVYKNIIH